MDRRFGLSALIASVLLALAACSQSEPAAVTGEQVRAYLLENPEVIEEALGKLQEKRQAAADQALAKSLVSRRADLERDARDFVAGNPNGAITVVEFFDYRCPYCKVARPEIDKLLAANKDIRYVMKEYPILSAASEAAARAAIGAKAQGKYLPVHMALMAEQTLDDTSIKRILTENDVDVDKALAVGTGAAATKQLEETRALARDTRVNGTPAFVIGDRMIAGWSPQDITDAIEAARRTAEAKPPQISPASGDDGSA
jgi:protein-disulfide isomerase